MAGWMFVNDATGTCSTVHTGGLEAFREQLKSIEYEISSVVAHNLKFDWKWFSRDYPDALIEPYHEINLYCTMTAEYLHSGHADRFITLENLAKKYGIKSRKTMDLSVYIDHGGLMEDIPKDELREYLEQDVKLVHACWKAQNKEHGPAPDMSYLHALSEMEMNGLPVDRKRCQRLAEDAAEDCEDFVCAVKHDIMTHCEWRDGDPIILADFEKKIKPTANRTLSFLLTGQPETVRTTSDKWTIKWKEGFGPELEDDEIAKIWKEKPTNLGYSMDEAHIDKMLKMIKGSPRSPWVFKIPKWRTQDKLLNTYYLPFLVKSEATGCLHPKLNTTATATGRLSSSDPNGQNMPDEARRLITAPEGHKIVEVDFKQLELVALATICDDEQMLEDINNGEDIHFNSGKTVFGWIDEEDMSEKDRKTVKNVNFGAVYGGKAPGLAYQTGVKKDTVQKLINSLYSRYPGIAKWQKEFYEQVVENMEPNGHDDKGEQRYKSTVNCQNRRYTFFETPSPKWLRAKMRRGYSFSPNQVYNYPIQGYAGWQIVLKYLYHLWAVSNPEKWKYLMTVHDSIVVCVPENDLDKFKSLAEDIANDMVDELDLPVPLVIDIKYGDTWS